MAEDAKKNAEFLEKCTWALIDARDDEQLSVLLKKMLHRVIALLGSDAHRAKALEVIKTVSGRIKAGNAVLPVDLLVKALKGETSSAFEKNFAMVFLEMAWRRSPPEQLGLLAPDLLRGLSKEAAVHQPVLLHMFLSAVEHISVEAREAMPHLPRADSELLRSFLMDLMLFAHTAAPKDAPAGAAPPLPPGLSAHGMARLASKAQCSGDVKAYLMARKIPVAKALQTGLLPHEAALPIAIVAMHNAHHEVRKEGEDSTKVRAARVNFEDSGMLRELFTLALGTQVQQQQQQPAAAAAAAAAAAGANPFERKPADPLVRQAAVAHLSRSVAAANTFPLAIQTIFECIYGPASGTKLKQAGMQFAVWTLRNAGDKVLEPVAGVMLSGLIKFLDTMPSDMEGGQTAIAQLRGFTFSAIGQMAQRVPRLFANDIKVASMLFAALSSEMPEVRVSVQEAVSLSCVAYKTVSGDNKEKLMQLLLQSVAQDAHQSRFCAVYWANRLFPFSEARARYICMLAVADKKVEVRDEAARGLVKPKPMKALESLIPEENAALVAEKEEQAYPCFVHMLEYLSSPGVAATRARTSAAVRSAMVSFCGDCLAHSAKGAGGLTRGQYLTEERSVAAVRFHTLIEEALGSSLSTGSKKSVNDTSLSNACFVALIDLFGARRDIVAGDYGGKLKWLEAFLFCNSEETRELVASVLGQIAVDMTPEQLEGIVGRMIEVEGAGESEREQRQGSLLALGYIVPGAGPRLKDEVRRKVVERLYDAIADRRIEVACSACRAVGLIGLEGALPVPEGDAGVGGLAEGGVEGGKVTSLAVVARLGELIAGKDKESKVYEAAAYALGSMCVTCRSGPLVDAAIEKLFAASKLIRVEEFQLCVGEALACVAGGRRFTSPALLCQLRMPSAYEDRSDDAEKASAEWAASSPEGGETETVTESEGEGCLLDVVMTRIMDSVLQDSKPQVRAAGAPYLLCLVKYCPGHALVQARLKLVQQHFSFMLSEKSEFMQEVASKGIGLVYDMCDDEAVKDELVATLAKGLMSGTIEAPTKAARQDEELFEEGQIKIDDKALGGGSLTTYKELCTVATELGQPELIYKFLNLAGHQRVWNSRRGAAFGFSSIAGKAADRMKPHLPKLIPKLYRYQFDPNERIQEAMGSLWQVVVTDPDKAKLEYLDDILAEIIPSVGSRLWRVREASCLALADLMSGKRFEQVEKHLVEVYRMSLRAMDDVKETVRNAGTMLNRAISTLCIRLCDSQQSGEVIAGKALGLLLPFLLEEGISQTAAEVRVASIQQMVKLVKGAGPSLRPYIPDIAVVLIESLSSLEPMMNTYVQQHAERMDSAAAEKFERARLSAARNTPLTETLEMCLRVIDEEGADATLPRLIPIVRTGVGLPTRCGVAKFVSTLAGSHATRQAVKKHSVKLLKSLATGLEDRSGVVRHAMASAAAKVFAVAKEQGKDEYVAHLTDMFEARGADDAGVRACVALAFKELMSAASDHMKDYHPAVLPLAFMARNDVDEAARDCWEQVWSEGAGSTAAGVRVLMGELAALIPKRLESASWEARRTTAVSCREYCEALGSSVAPHFNGLLTALENCVKGKVWDGKEEVLMAISALAVAAKVQVRSDGLATRVGCLLFGECGKKRKEYRTGAFKAAKEFASEFKVEVGGASSLLPNVADLFASDEGGSKASSGPSAGRDADAEAAYEVQMEEKGRELLRGLALECIHKAWVPSSSSPEETALVAGWVLPSVRLGRLAERIAAVEAAESMAGEGGGGLSKDTGPMLEGLIQIMTTPGTHYREVHALAARAATKMVRGTPGLEDSMLQALRAAADGLTHEEGKAKQEAQSLIGALASAGGAGGGDIEMAG